MVEFTDVLRREKKHLLQCNGEMDKKILDVTYNKNKLILLVVIYTPNK